MDLCGLPGTGEALLWVPLMSFRQAPGHFPGQETGWSSSSAYFPASAPSKEDLLVSPSGRVWCNQRRLPGRRTRAGALSGSNGLPVAGPGPDPCMEDCPYIPETGRKGGQQGGKTANETRKLDIEMKYELPLVGRNGTGWQSERGCVVLWLGHCTLLTALPTSAQINLGIDGPWLLAQVHTEFPATFQAVGTVSKKKKKRGVGRN